MDSVERRTRGLRRRPGAGGFGLVVGLLALVVAMSGTAYAVSVAPKNSVVSKSIKNGQVKKADIGRNAVTGHAIKDGTVASPDIRDGSVWSSDIKDGAVQSSDILDGTVAGADLAEGAVGVENLRPVTTASVVSAPTADADGTTNGGDHGVVTATATCPSGGVAISGGAYWTDASTTGNEQENNYLHASYRYGANAWRATGFVDMGSQGAVRLAVSVTCLMGSSS